MKILHVVSTFSDDGTSGGVIRVALEQARALTAAGHDVTLVSGWRGRGQPPTEVEGVPAVLRRVHPPPGLGERAHVGTTIYAAIHDQVRAADVVHIHLCRDFITTAAAAAARRAKTPYVVQTHGMITPPATLRRKILDGPTVRGLRHAHSRLCLTEAELKDMHRLVPDGRSVLVRNAVDLLPRDPATESPVVVFLGRIHQRKRADHFVSAAAELAGAWPEVRWLLIGPDEGAGAALEQQIRATGIDSIAWLGAMSRPRALNVLSTARVYVLPSIDEPFPMTLVEALALGVPSICTSSCGLAGLIQSNDAGIVVEPKQSTLTTALRSLLSDDRLRRELSANAVALTARELTQTAVADTITQEYRLAIGSPAAD